MLVRAGRFSVSPSRPPGMGVWVQSGVMCARGMQVSPGKPHEPARLRLGAPARRTAPAGHMTSAGAQTTGGREQMGATGSATAPSRPGRATPAAGGRRRICRRRRRPCRHRRRSPIAQRAAPAATKSPRNGGAARWRRWPPRPHGTAADRRTAARPRSPQMPPAPPARPPPRPTKSDECLRPNPPFPGSACAQPHGWTAGASSHPPYPSRKHREDQTCQRQLACQQQHPPLRSRPSLCA